jgi:hypothetical protein
MATNDVGIKAWNVVHAGKNTRSHGECQHNSKYNYGIVWPIPYFYMEWNRGLPKAEVKAGREDTACWLA